MKPPFNCSTCASIAAYASEDAGEAPMNLEEMIEMATGSVVASILVHGIEPVRKSLCARHAAVLKEIGKEVREDWKRRAQ